MYRRETRRVRDKQSAINRPSSNDPRYLGGNLDGYTAVITSDILRNRRKSHCRAGFSLERDLAAAFYIA